MQVFKVYMYGMPNRFSVAWAALVGVMVFSSKTQVSSSELREVVYVICCGLMVILLLFAAARSFSDIVNGESPFTMKQVNRFRFAALLLVLLAIVDAILSTNFYTVSTWQDLMSRHMAVTKWGKRR